MKIYPSTHKIKTITDSYIDNDLNIPLAYINVDYTKYNIEKEINENFNADIKTPVLINSSYTNPDLKIFNDYGEEVNTKGLFSNKNGTLLYSPETLISFQPKFFLWKAVVKRDLNYKILNTYNINVKSYDEKVNNLISPIFTNPAERSLTPTNIKINNNSMHDNVFTNLTDEETDFLFIQNVHGAYYDINCKNPIDIYSYMSKYTNLWISTEDPRSIDSQYNILTSPNDIEYSIKSPLLNSNSKIYTNTYFDLTLITEKPGIKIHNIFQNDYVAPILIVEYINNGFVILSHASILKNASKNYALIFEVLMYVYLNAYAATDWINEWITYKVPDYEVVNNILQSKKNFVSSTNLNSYFSSDNTSMNLVNVFIRDDDTVKTAVSSIDLNDTTSAIKCIGKINNKLVFELDESIPIDGYVEPEKPIGWKSIYQDKKIYYVDQINYLVKDDLTNKIFLIRNNNDLLVKIYPFKNSYLGINITKDVNITIPYVRTENNSIVRLREAKYSVYIINNKIDYCFSEDYEEAENKYILFEIIIGQTKDAITIHDIRQLGGGLPEEEEDNFNLFDIGNINGRPYRSTGSLVITMPTKYQKYEKEIQDVVDKYKVGEDYIVLFFEDKEE